LQTDDDHAITAIAHQSNGPLRRDRLFVAHSLIVKERDISLQSHTLAKPLSQSSARFRIEIAHRQSQALDA
jgi:hypothetical protein